MIISHPLQSQDLDTVCEELIQKWIEFEQQNQNSVEDKTGNAEHQGFYVQCSRLLSAVQSGQEVFHDITISQQVRSGQSV